MCSCSGCQCGASGMSSATQASQRVNLELILEEVKVLQKLIETINQQSSLADTANPIDSLILLNNLQHLCAKWWDISKEFFNLNQLYAYDEEGHGISGLIWRSQVLLVVAVGLVAVITLLLSKESCTLNQISNRFSTLVKVLNSAYLTEVKLCQIILSKMVATIKISNPYAQ